MPRHVFSGSEPTAIVRFLAEYEEVCRLSDVPESIAVCSMQLYVKEQTESFQSIRLTRSSITVDSKRSKMLGTYGILVNVLLQTYEKNEFIKKACNDGVNFR